MFGVWVSPSKDYNNDTEQPYTGIGITDDTRIWEQQDNHPQLMKSGPYTLYFCNVNMSAGNNFVYFGIKDTL